MIRLYDIVRYCNCIKNFGLLTAISLKNDNSKFVTLSTMREINHTSCVISIRIMNLHSNYVREYRIGKFHVNHKKSTTHTERGLFGNLPTTRRRSCRPVSNACRGSIAWGRRYRSRIDVRRPSSRCVSDNESGPHTRDLGELPRGLRGGNSICSYKRA